MTELQLKGLVKYYGDVPAVRGIDLTVRAGKVVSILGPSGCGKTTTLRMIAGLIDPTAGDVLFDGESVLHLPPERRRIGMVFQRYVLFPHMTVEGNVSFGLRMRGVARAEIARRVAEVLELVQLSHLGKRFPSQLSGGQQQRVAIARAVVTDPAVMLMDEPLSNLDAKLREDMRAFLIGLQRRLNITTILVTHDQSEAIELSDKVAVMFDGHVVQEDTPTNVFMRPANRRVAEFMGATNFIPGRLVQRSGDATVVESALGRLQITGADLSEGQAVVLTVRPEHVDLAPRGPVGDSANVVRGRIRSAVFKGGFIDYLVQAGDTQLNVLDRSNRQFETGSEVAVRLPADRLWAFPEQGGAQPAHEATA